MYAIRSYYAHYCVAFTGAGISVESGIPPFRGKNGLWNKYDPKTFEIDYFLQNSARSWEVLRDIFYDLFGRVLPNTAHYALAEMEQRGLLKSVITQNIRITSYNVCYTKLLRTQSQGHLKTYGHPP